MSHKVYLGAYFECSFPMKRSFKEHKVCPNKDCMSAKYGFMSTAFCANCGSKATQATKETFERIHTYQITRKQIKTSLLADKATTGTVNRQTHYFAPFNYGENDGTAVFAADTSDMDGFVVPVDELDFRKALMKSKFLEVYRKDYDTLVEAYAAVGGMVTVGFGLLVSENDAD